MTETVIHLDDAPRFGQEGTEITGYASPSRGSHAISAWRVLLHPGAGSPVHQLTEGEVFLALSGRAKFEFAERAHDIAAGDAICVPAETPFRLANPHEESFEAICCMPANGKGRIGDGESFRPPWAE